MKLTDILPLEQWVALETDIHQKFGVDTNVFNTEGVRISEFKKWINRLCPEIKATDRGQSFICAVAHMNIAAMAKNAGKAVIEECDAGLFKLVVPIVVNNEFLGALGACGMLLEDGEADSFLINKMTGIDEDRIENLAGDLPRMTSETAQAMGRYVESKINEIVARYEADSTQ